MHRYNVAAVEPRSTTAREGMRLRAQTCALTMVMEQGGNNNDVTTHAAAHEVTKQVPGMCVKMEGL